MRRSYSSWPLLVGRLRESVTFNRACVDWCALESLGLFVQVGELEKREVKASEELEALRSEVGDGSNFSKLI